MVKITRRRPLTQRLTRRRHSSVHYEPFLELVRSQGYPATCPGLPTDKGLATTDIYEDAECINSELQRLIQEEGKEVILVCHSYGGAVASLACHESYGKRFRQDKGEVGGIIRLIHIPALISPMNEPIIQSDDAPLPPSIEVRVITPSPLWQSARQLNQCS